MSIVYCPEGHRHEVTIQPGARQRAIGSAREAVAVVCQGAGEFLGDGCSREVYLGPSGRFVYKRSVLSYDSETDSDYRDQWANQAEFENANPASGRPSIVSPTSAYTIDGELVLCQPRVPTLGRDVRNERGGSAYEELYDRVSQKALETCRAAWGDLHGTNFGLTKAGHIRVFDVA